MPINHRTALLLPAVAVTTAGLFTPPAAADHHAESGETAEARSIDTVTLELARAIIDAARAEAEALDVKMNIAVVDAGANLVAFERMDDAWLGSTDIAIRKAETARFFDMPTGELGKLSQPGGPLYEIESSNGGLITFPGGVPIRNADGAVIGAIGVSGDSVDNDHTVAAAGAAVSKP